MARLQLLDTSFLGKSDVGKARALKMGRGDGWVFITWQADLKEPEASHSGVFSLLAPEN